MNRTRKRTLGCERGSVLISGLLLTLALLMVLGAAVDLGHAFVVRRDLSTQADDAALAGAQQLDLQAVHAGRLALNPDLARSAALATLAAQPGLTATADASSGVVHVQLCRRFPTVLLRLVGLSELTISAQANATPRAP